MFPIKAFGMTPRFKSGWYCWWFRNPKQPPGMYPKPHEYRDIYYINWCRFSSINSMAKTPTEVVVFLDIGPLTCWVWPWFMQLGSWKHLGSCLLPVDFWRSKTCSLPSKKIDYLGIKRVRKSSLGGGFKRLFYFYLYLGKWSNLTNIFQMGNVFPGGPAGQKIVVSFPLNNHRWQLVVSPSFSQDAETNRCVQSKWNPNSTYQISKSI